MNMDVKEKTEEGMENKKEEVNTQETKKNHENLFEKLEFLFLFIFVCTVCVLPIGGFVYMFIVYTNFTLSFYKIVITIFIIASLYFLLTKQSVYDVTGRPADYWIAYTGALLITYFFMEKLTPFLAEFFNNLCDF